MTDQTVFRVADLPQNRPTTFSIQPDAGALAQLAEDLGLLGLRKLRFDGVIAAQGKTDWRLSATLGATVIQPCVVTLDPVTTRIDADVERVFVAEYETPSGDEVEMPEDDSIDPLGSDIDVFAIMSEALALNVPQYPRAEQARLAETNFTEPGKSAMTDEDTRPFAGLAALRDGLKKE